MLFATTRVIHDICVSSSVVRPECLHPLFKCFTLCCDVAEIALESFHRKTIPHECRLGPSVEILHPAKTEETDRTQVPERGRTASVVTMGRWSENMRGGYSRSTDTNPSDINVWSIGIPKTTGSRYGLHVAW